MRTRYVKTVDLFNRIERYSYSLISQDRAMTTLLKSRMPTYTDRWLVCFVNAHLDLQFFQTAHTYIRESSPFYVNDEDSEQSVSYKYGLFGVQDRFRHFV